MHQTTALVLSLTLCCAASSGCGGHSSSSRGASTTAPSTTGGGAPTTSTTGGGTTFRAPRSLVEDFATTQFRDATTDADWSNGRLVTTNAAFGDGSDGVFAPTADLTIDTSVQATFQFTRVSIPAGVTITGVGPNPLVILAQDSVVIEGTIDVAGQDGQDAQAPGTAGQGGAPGPGGGRGGDGSATDNDLARDGQGPGGASASVGDSGAGGGFALVGSDGKAVGGSPPVNPSFGGIAYGNPSLNPLDAGSGGSGGRTAMFLGNRTSGASGPGGGGGGGALRVLARSDLVFRGWIRADGGNGGGMRRNPSGEANAAGGGSGGGVLLQSGQELAFQGGWVSARGGHAGFGEHDIGSIDTIKTGGNGSPGRIRLEDLDGTIRNAGANIFPRASVAVVTTAFSGGNGTLGAYVAPLGTSTLDTSNGPLHYTRFEIPTGAVVVGRGPNPLEIYATGDIVIEGDLIVSGEDGLNGLDPANGAPPAGGLAGAGGGAGGVGGQGGATPLAGNDGLGPGGGKAGPASTNTNYAFSGSGAGFGTAGQDGNTNPGARPVGGVVYGNPELNPLVGGSGGASGSGHARRHSASGGGGGGALRLQAQGAVTLRGRLLADGGQGGGSNSGTNIYVAGGAGGSGGAILVQATRIDLGSGEVSARGGLGGHGYNGRGFTNVRQGDESLWSHGGRGGHGRIRLESVEPTVGGVDLKSFTGNRSNLLPNYVLTPASTAALQVAAPTGVQAQSAWYDSNLPDPIYGAPVIDGKSLATVTFEWQGTDADPAGNPDLSSASGWTSDLTTLRRRFVRFRVTLTPAAEVRQITIPIS